MGRFTSYGIATIIAISQKDLDNAIKRTLRSKSIDEFQLQDLRLLYPEDTFEIIQTETHFAIFLKDHITGTHIYSLLKDFSSIYPYKHQLSKEVIEEIGSLIKEKPILEVMDIASRKEYECFQTFRLPDYLHYAPITVGDETIYVKTDIYGILIAFNYAKVITEDSTEPYGFLTSLLQYRLKDNPLSPALIAFLSV